MKIDVIYTDQFKKGKVSIARQVTESWEDFVSSTKDTESWGVITSATEKAQLPMMLLGTLHEDGGRRQNMNIASRGGFVLDYDYDPGNAKSVQMTFEDIQNDLSDFEYLLYSSVSYGVKAGDRCRILVPFNQPISGEKWQELRESFKARFAYIDSSCFTLSQGQNVPARYSGKFPYVHYNKGRLLNPLTDIAYVESVQKFDANVFDQIEIDDAVLSTIFDDVVKHCSGSLNRSRAWFFAQVMKSYGVYDYRRVALVQRSDANTNPQEFFKNTISSNVNVFMLKGYLPDGYKFPAELTQYSVPEIDEYRESNNATDDYQYDQEFWLEEGEYLSDIRGELNLNGNVLLIGDCGIGKTRFTTDYPDEFVVGVPLRIIAQQNAADKEDFNNIRKGTGTYQQIRNMPDRLARTRTLVIDEAHSLYLDGFRGDCNTEVVEQFERFRGVVLMSGTVRPEYFSNIKFDRVIRVHKKQPFRKVIRQVRTSPENKLEDIALKKILSLGEDRKSIILFNYIKGVKGLQEKISQAWPDHRLMRITAEDGDRNAEYEAFVERQTLGGYNGLIGTNSLVEGINVRDELESCDVHIIGDISPERIEQVTNRFRNCTGTINVYHYVYDTSRIEYTHQEINVDEVLRSARELRDVTNKHLGLLNYETVKSHLNGFSREMRGTNLYWDWRAELAEIDYCQIDNLLAENRTLHAMMNYGQYKRTLGEYGFEFEQAEMHLTGISVADAINAVKELDEEQRIEGIKWLSENFDERIEGWNVESNDSAVQQQMEYLLSFMGRGLRASDVREYLSRLATNKSYWERLRDDLRDFQSGNVVRDFVLSELPKLTASTKNGNVISSENVRVLGQYVADFVLANFFNGDRGAMLSTHWRSVLNDECQLLTPQAGREIIGRYITLDKSKMVRINGTLERASLITALSRTGFVLDERKRLKVSTGSATPAPDKTTMELLRAKFLKRM